ncbi:MAG: endonuclease/exonuclease/phosphatase family protein, partial [Patescibacteria group bacterium]
MKIYSWNILFRNKEFDRAFEFIRTSDFDIFCLQEVPADFLTRLETLPYHYASTIDAERIGRGTTPIYLVILSRYPITGQNIAHFPEYWAQWPWRTRLFVRLMRPFHFTKIKNRHGFSVDITIDGRTFHVFNLHLILAHPDLRLAEFEHALVERDRSRPGIVCGDFNILESPKITLLNWLLGGRVSDIILWMRERTH